MRQRPSRRNRLLAGRARRSTLILVAAFFGVLALYILVRPVSAPRTTPADYTQSLAPTVSGTPSPATAPLAPLPAPSSPVARFAAERRSARTGRRHSAG